MRGFELGQLTDGRAAYVARRPLSRLLGLAFLNAPPELPLLIPRCSSVHTFGMRFALDIEFLDASGDTLDLRRAVPPRRFVRRRGAASVLELPSRS